MGLKDFAEDRSDQYMSKLNRNKTGKSHIKEKYQALSFYGHAMAIMNYSIC